MADAGRIIPIHKGDWAIHGVYEVLDQVYYSGSTYIAKNNIADSAIVPSSDTTNWILSARGFEADTLSGITGTDTSGLLGTIGDTVGGQALMDKIADMVSTKLLPVTNVVNTTTTTVAGKALDARQANSNIEGSLAYELKRHLIINVKDFGAIGDGITDDTAAIQSALNASRHVYFPEGSYLISNTIYAKNCAQIYGAGAELTKIIRSATMTADTMHIGSSASDNHANNFRVSGIWFLRNLVYNSEGIVNKLNTNICHLKVWYGQNFDIDHCMFWACPTNIRIINSTVGRIYNNTIEGTFWDYTKTTDEFHEGYAGIMIGNEDVKTSAYCQLINIYNNHIGGGVGSGERTITVGTQTVTTNINIGSLAGILVNECEGMTIYGNYIGGFGDAGINLAPNGICANIKITDNFIDPAGQSCIRTSNNGEPVIGLIIAHNHFNLQKNGMYSINVTGDNTTKSCYKLEITGNIFENSMATHVLLFGCVGAIINGNTFNSYNVWGGGMTNTIFNCGINVSSFCKKINCFNNTYGGGVNTLETDPNCVNGVYFEDGYCGYAINEIDIGMSGTGKIITGGRQKNFRYSFSANVQAQTTDTLLPFNTLVFDDVINDIYYDSGIKCNSNGAYAITVSILGSCLVGSENQVKIKVNGVFAGGGLVNPAKNGQFNECINTTVHLKAGDVVQVYATSDDSSLTIYGSAATNDTFISLAKI